MRIPCLCSDRLANSGLPETGPRPKHGSHIWQHMSATTVTLYAARQVASLYASWIFALAQAAYHYSCFRSSIVNFALFGSVESIYLPLLYIWPGAIWFTTAGKDCFRHLLHLMSISSRAMSSRKRAGGKKQNTMWSFPTHRTSRLRIMPEQQPAPSGTTSPNSRSSRSAAVEVTNWWATPSTLPSFPSPRM